jgi:ribosomal protein L24E
MAKLPCILCGKMIEARGGMNTVYCREDGETYACCSGGCDGKGALDTDVRQELIRQLSDDERKKHRVTD